ncbi:hypothetical protein CU633_18085 [Bacillus sp. V3-13]|uniref:hypothetical protein n=1 Tax=Bacillus sp. V3-13 TaxID=2053728 RepID=UPI000C76FE31|nr:hypothetical protein [Bacillus sp. V3-13]PLR75977.1 hypothetical protein CU633_18085 [Bacillus sp. V3-13]
MAREAKGYFDQYERVEISILLGLGDECGKAAVEWTADQFNTHYLVTEKGNKRTVESFKDGRKIDFGGDLGVHQLLLACSISLKDL